MKFTLFLVVAFALCVLISLPASADEWSKTYNVSSRPELQVGASDANIHVTTWDQSTIEAKVITAHYRIGEGGIRVEERQNGNAVEIEVRYPHHSLNIHWGWQKVDIIVHMPRDGRVNLRTGDGKIEVANLKGEMDLDSGDGSVNLNAVDGTLHASTSNGHIQANGRFDELDLKTGDGNIEVNAAGGSALVNTWTLETGDGGVFLEVPQDLSADVSLHTSDGHIDLDMPVAAEGPLHENEIQGKLNRGGKLLTIRTGDGSIRLTKEVDHQNREAHR